MSENEYDGCVAVVTGARLYRPSTRSFMEVSCEAGLTKNEIKFLVKVTLPGWEVFQWIFEE